MNDTQSVFAGPVLPLQSRLSAIIVKRLVDGRELAVPLIPGPAADIRIMEQRDAALFHPGHVCPQLAHGVLVLMTGVMEEDIHFGGKLPLDGRVHVITVDERPVRASCPRADAAHDLPDVIDIAGPDMTAVIRNPGEEGEGRIAPPAAQL